MPKGKEDKTMSTEQQRVREMMENIARGKDVGNRLFYDPRQKRIRAGEPASVFGGAPAGNGGEYTINLQPEDLRVFVKGSASCLA